MHAVLMQLRDSGLRPSHAMASHLVRNCSADDVIFVETCLSQLQEASLRPSLKLLNTLLGFYIQRQDQEAVSRTYARIMALYPAESSPRDSKVGVRRHRRGPNADTAALLFSNGTTLSYISECYKAIQAWKNNTLSSERAQTGLFQALDKIAPIQSKASVALEWMNRLEQDGYRPTRGALDAVVTSFLRQGRIADAFRLIARLRQLRAHQTSSAVTTQLLQAVGVPRAGGQAAGSEAIWQQLHHHVEQQKPLSAKMFRSIVSAMGRTGEVRGLWFLFNLLGRKAGTYESRTLVESGPASRGDFGSIALSSGPLDPRPTHPSPEDLSHNRVLVASVDPESGSVLHHLLCSMGKIRHGSTDETIALFRALPATHQRPLSYSLLRSIRRRKTQHQSFIDIVSTWFQQGTVELEPKKLAQELEDMVRRILKHEADPASPQQASRSMSHSTPAGLSKIHAWNKSWENDDSMIEAVQRASTAALAKVVCENLRRVRSGEDVAYALEELQSCRLFHA
ncbi:uncharacterized protein BJ171DRAFT_485957 [Polychytrium aggregatum]|uniref:uncharacterized protein n=1 Tax=Polychytrium aggregatum TaxID=110093 RepID=UPI0022FE5C26|nr:uncharacterized protein BJ171DRAFT_485957 [Polychytrium aggregatum]KAI9209260.1 hypothetical protein BJ171DRAFT_485957 [Polychytrium aggregatum]